jgi:hypothetical protein
MHHWHDVASKRYAAIFRDAEGEGAGRVPVLRERNAAQGLSNADAANRA